MTALLRLDNGEIELDVTLGVGPRILRYALRGGRNVLHDTGDLEPGGDEFRLRGGHRLWVAPEDPGRTYAPDNGPVEHDPLPRGVRATTPADPRFGLERTIEVELDERGPGVRVGHRITNRGRGPQTLAAWALTVLAPGGVGLVPLPPRGAFPEDPKGPEDFAPRATMSIWPYTRLDDPRLTWSERWIRLRQDPRGDGSCKLGLRHREGWAAYWNEGVLFVKRFGWVEGATYPDGGVNFETYTDPRFLELESLSPLVTLGPGESVLHEERWELYHRPFPEEGLPPERLLR